MDRSNIDKKYLWDLEVIYDNTESFMKDFNEVKDKVNEIKKYENSMLNSAKEFYETINYYYMVTRKLEKLYSYANLLFDSDTSINENQSLRGKVSNLYAELSNKAYFITPNILKLSWEEIEKFIKEEPKLKEYEKMLRDEFRFKEHTLSDNEEKLLSSLHKMMGNNYDTYELFKDCDLIFGNITNEEGNTVKLDNSNYSLYIESRDRRVRKETFEVLYKTYSEFKNTFASLISNNINEEVSISKVRKYNSAIEASLFQDEIPLSVYDNLINSVNDGLDVLYKYYDIKRKVLEVDELHLYDVYVSMTKEYNKKYNFDEEVMIALFGYCFDKSALHRNYIQTVAAAWAKNNIKTFTDLDIYYEKQEKLNIIANNILKKLGLKRNLSQYEYAYIEKWVIDFKYNLDIIEIALKRTTSKANPNFDYLDKLLSENV